MRPPMQQAPQQGYTASNINKSQQPTSSLSTQPKTHSPSAKRKKGSEKKTQQPTQQSMSNSSPEQIIAPTPDLDDDEPDRL